MMPGSVLRLGEQSALANPKVLKQPCGRRLISMPCERHAVQHDSSGRHHAAADGDRRSIETMMSSASVPRCRAAAWATSRRTAWALAPALTMDGEIDIAARCSTAGRRAAKQVRKIDFVRRGGD